MIVRTPFLLTLTAFALTACAVALGGEARAPVAGTGPFTCALVAEAQAGGGTRLEARLSAREALQASYDLRVSGPGVSIDQGGDLSLGAGESAVLGEANVSTRASALDARLSVTAGGRTFACPLQPS